MICKVVASVSHVEAVVSRPNKTGVGADKGGGDVHVDMNWEPVRRGYDESGTWQIFSFRRLMVRIPCYTPVRRVCHRTPVTPRVSDGHPVRNRNARRGK